MNRRERRKLAKLQPVHETVSLEELVPMVSQRGGVPVSAREGVFIHSFVCNACGLHFNLYSWLPDRHRAESTFCPECGQRGRFRHWRVQTSELHGTVNPGHPGEIFRHCPAPGASLLDDTTMAGLQPRTVDI